MMRDQEQKIKIRYNRSKKYYKPFEVITETFMCVYKDNCDPQYALDKYDWVTSVVDSFSTRQEAEQFMLSIDKLEVA